MELNYLVRPRQTALQKPPLLILLHGIGSNEKALFALAEQLPGKYLVVALRAPIGLGENKYGWYQADFSSGKPVINHAQEVQSRQAIIDCIGRLRAILDYDEQEVYLCGFSQGAIMSYSVALTRPDLVKGIAILSGRLLEEIKPSMAPKEKLQQLRIYISHGINDTVLPVQYARNAVAFLTSLDLTPTFNEYPAGHQLNTAMHADLVKWLG